MARAVWDNIVVLIFIFLVIGNSTGMLVGRGKRDKQGAGKKEEWLSGESPNLPVNCTAYPSVQLKKWIGKVE